MKHVSFNKPGSAEVMYFTDSQLPVLTQGQVLIKVHAAGVNGPDIKQREGAYPAPKGASAILGLEVAGEIIELADDVTQWKVGDKVCALVPGGGYAEQVITDASHCLPIPKNYTYEQAAALPETCFTVWGNMVVRAELTAGESVLIHGGSGGIGTTAIQMASALGATVFATSGSDKKCQYCLEQGATVAVNYHQKDFVEPILEATNGTGVNVVFDIAGGDFVNRNLKVVAMDGRMVSVAMQRGMKAEVDIFRLMAKRIRWTGSTLRPQSIEAKAEIAQGLKQHVWPMLESGKMHINLDKVFAFNDVIAAHQYMESGQHQGKIILKLI
ncbi:NAD(P)H-quinone oxidoreductase [Shewanella electrodiphila]|uniref:NAD(P)H-quinone oxidoreductase n=1 Tax=Shewanella electrodiphila TaxID=934143 RepID=A0ABT0KRD9_9GAMM|nr:NAD(P)H-quinone oxidoreductase [Shewanella electrodiphila]MCL1046416.1 NAD(P)H-quinone oxidoreductase [Shewanella electrodiphila]